MAVRESIIATTSPLRALPAPNLSRLAARATRDWVPPLMIILGVLAFWQIASSTGLVKDFVLPGVLTVVGAWITDHELILKHARPTIIEALLGFAIGNMAAIVLAVLFVHSSLAERGLFPVALGYRSVPTIALTPVLVLAMGNGMEPKIFIASMSCFFVTLVNMMRGLRSVDAEAAELMHSLSANWWQVLTKLRWPASMPFLFTSLKLGAGSAFLGALVAEWVGSTQGLGYLIVLSSYQFHIPTMWATIFTASAMALSAFFVVSLVERRVTRWARGVQLPE
jgi:NitT/TauT family transport system permease protein